MNLELVTIGTELLLGLTIDTNGAWLGRTFAASGIRVVQRTSVSDDGEEIRRAVRAALERTGAVVTTGGLGPTSDDVTKQVVAELFDAPLEFDDRLWAELVARFQRLGRRIVDRNRSQAEVPRGAQVLRNRWGTAPGLWLEDRRGVVIMLPGVPREMMELVQHEVLPRLEPRAHGRVIRSQTVRTTMIPESTLAERLGDAEAAIAPATLAYLPGLDGVDLRLTAWDAPPDEAGRLLAAGAAIVRERAGEFAYGEGETDLAAVVLAALEQRGWRLAVAESCTGGLLGGRLTAIPGSSRVFSGGIVSYDNAAKTEHLGVPASLIAANGAVSGEVALAMAQGARRAFGVDAAVSITGIAGPDGGTPEKPVGTVWIGGCAGDHEDAVRHILFGSRNEIRARAAQAALFHLARMLRSGQVPSR